MRVPPSAFGIATAFTGGGKYVPDDIRFQILNRLSFRSVSNTTSDCPSTPGEPLFALTLSYASHTSCLENTNDLSCHPAALTLVLPDKIRLPTPARHR